MEPVRFKGCVRFEDGEMVCFCYESDVKAGQCECKSKFDLPECVITLEQIAGTRPSEQEAPAIVKEIKSAEGHLRELAKQSQEIKKGLQNLEKAAKGSRFRV